MPFTLTVLPMIAMSLATITSRVGVTQEPPTILCLEVVGDGAYYSRSCWDQLESGSRSTTFTRVSAGIYDVILWANGRKVRTVPLIVGDAP